MTERAYTIKEIDRMRYLVGQIGDLKTNAPNPYVYFSANVGSPISIGALSYRNVHAEYVENRLRTYMIAGIEPQELEAEYEEVKKNYDELNEKFKKEQDERMRRLEEEQKKEDAEAKKPLISSWFHFNNK